MDSAINTTNAKCSGCRCWRAEAEMKNAKGKVMKTCTRCRERKLKYVNTTRCPHNRQKHFCRECNGNGVCSEHNKIRHACIPCKKRKALEEQQENAVVIAAVQEKMVHLMSDFDLANNCVMATGIMCTILKKMGIEATPVLGYLNSVGGKISAVEHMWLKAAGETYDPGHALTMKQYSEFLKVKFDRVEEPPEGVPLYDFRGELITRGEPFFRTVEDAIQTDTFMDILSTPPTDPEDEEMRHKNYLVYLLLEKTFVK